MGGFFGNFLTFVGVWTILGIITLYVRQRAFRRVMRNGGTVDPKLIDMTYGIIAFWPFALLGAIKLFGLFPAKPKES